MKKRGTNLFIISTPYHLLTSSLLCKSGDIAVFIGERMNSKCMNKLRDTCFGSNYYTVPSFYSYKENKFSLMFFRRNMSRLRKQIREKNIDNMFSFNDVNPIDQWIIKSVQYENKVVIVEEGIGLYRDTIKRHKRLFQLFGKIVFGGKYEEINRIGESSSVTDILCTNASKLSEIQKTKNIEILAPKDYSDISEKMSINRIDGRIWFVGQPLVEDSVMSEAEYISGIQQLCDIAKENRTKLIIKPHPREKLGKYSIWSSEDALVIRESDIPIELLVDNSSKVEAYTYYSSAILELAKINNCKATCLYKMYKNIDLPDNIDELMKEANVRIMENWDG